MSDSVGMGRVRCGRRLLASEDYGEYPPRFCFVGVTVDGPFSYRISVRVVAVGEGEFGRDCLHIVFGDAVFAYGYSFDGGGVCGRPVE